MRLICGLAVTVAAGVGVSREEEVAMGTGPLAIKPAKRSVYVRGRTVYQWSDQCCMHSQNDTM